MALETIAAANTSVDDVRIVTLDRAAYDELRAELASATPLRILQGVRVLHERGYHHARVLPRMSPSGMHWRVTITVAPAAGNETDRPVARANAAGIRYSTSGSTSFAGGEVTAATDPEAVADLILAALPGLMRTADDPPYVAWFAGLMRLVDRSGTLPIADADYFDDRQGWEVGWAAACDIRTHRKSPD